MRITPEAKAIIDQTFADMGMMQKEGASRLMTWFASLDAETRYAILGPESLRPHVIRIILERMTHAGETESAHPLDAEADEDLDAAEHEGDVPKPQDKPDQNDKAHG